MLIKTLVGTYREWRGIITLVSQAARIVYAVKCGKPPKRVYKILDLMDLYQQNRSKALYLKLIELEAKLGDNGVPREELTAASTAVYQSVQHDYASLGSEIDAMMNKNNGIDVEYIIEKYYFMIWLREHVRPRSRSWYTAR